MNMKSAGEIDYMGLQKNVFNNFWLLEQKAEVQTEFAKALRQLSGKVYVDYFFDGDYLIIDSGAYYDEDMNIYRVLYNAMTAYKKKYHAINTELLSPEMEQLLTEKFSHTADEIEKLPDEEFKAIVAGLDKLRKESDGKDTEKLNDLYDIVRGKSNSWTLEKYDSYKEILRRIKCEYAAAQKFSKAVVACAKENDLFGQYKAGFDYLQEWKGYKVYIPLQEDGWIINEWDFLPYLLEDAAGKVRVCTRQEALQIEQSPHKCPVCGKTEFPRHNSMEICKFCGWKDSHIQEYDCDTLDGVPNDMSLNIARDLWRKHKEDIRPHFYWLSSEYAWKRVKIAK